MNPEVPTAQPAAGEETVPKNAWPGAFGAYKFSKNAVKFNLGTVLGLTIFAMVASGVSNIIDNSNSTNPVSVDSGAILLAFIVAIVSLALSIWIGAALTTAIVSSVKKEKITIGDALSNGGKMFLPYLGLSIILSIITIASLILFIIPFFFIFPRLMLAEYYLIEGKKGIIDAISASWNATKGNVGKVWGIIGASILMGLLMITIIGIPFAIYFLLMYSAAYGVLYFFLNKQEVPAAAAQAKTDTVGPIIEQR